MQLSLSTSLKDIDSDKIKDVIKEACAKIRSYREGVNDR